MEPRVIEFTVKGDAIGQGSMQSKVYKAADGSFRSSVRHNNPNLLHWRGRIAAVAQSVVTELPFLAPVPVRVVVTFYLSPPQRPEHVKPVNTKDLDKLARAALDSMTGVLYTDDQQVTDLHVKKRYAADRRPSAVFLVCEDDESVDVVPPMKRAKVPRVQSGDLWDANCYRIERGMTR